VGYKEKAAMVRLTILSRICVAGIGLLAQGIFGQSGVALLQRQFMRSDSAVATLVNKPETRMKEIAPAESLFQASLSQHPEFLCIIRTNSKGSIVNAVSREDTVFFRAADVADQPWYEASQKTLKPYYGPPQNSRDKHTVLFWSRPIRVRNNLGILRFGGVVSVQINAIEICRQFSNAYSGRFQILLDGKGLYHRGSDSSLRMIEKPVRVPGISGLTCRFVADTSAVSESGVKDSADVSASGLMKKKEADSQAFSPGISSVVQPAQAETAVYPRRQLSYPSGRLPVGIHESTVWKMGWVGTCIIIFVFCLVWFLLRRAKKQRAAQSVAVIAASGGADGIHDPVLSDLHADTTGQLVENEEISPKVPLPQAQDIEELKVNPDKSIGEAAPEQPLETGEPQTESGRIEYMASSVSQEEEAALRQRVRAELFQEIKRDIIDKETTEIRNAVIAELKADIRHKLEKNEAEAIRAALQQEITGAWRAEIQEKYYAAFREKEMENLVKIIREKIVEKEMPLLVEQQRAALSEEIREKMAATFSQQIEEHQRSVLKAEIVKKLQLEEYPHLLQHERDTLRSALALQVADKETKTFEAQARDELAGKIRTHLLSETESIENRLREELTQSIRAELVQRERDSIIVRVREETEDRLRAELIENERQAIHDRLLDEMTRQQRERIAMEELQSIIESERRRIAQEEAPALRQQLRTQVREEELEALHARVKTELYAETVDALRGGLEEKYAALLESRTTQNRQQAYNQAFTEIRRTMEEEYRNLIDHVERLSGSMTKIEALDSLSQTITLLTDEKKKYKYFNLNSAQTESLLEYLKRVQSRFNIFLDKVDESVREVELKINSVMNKLSNGA